MKIVLLITIAIILINLPVSNYDYTVARVYAHRVGSTSVRAYKPHKDAPTLSSGRNIRSHIISKFGIHWKKALCIARRESNLSSEAIHRNLNGTIDYGIFQINSFYHRLYSTQKLLDWKTNIDYAYTISSGGTSFSLWTTNKFCKGF